MNWKLYKLVYEGLSEITIGADTLGFVQRTRYYIPARNLWGAVTEKLVHLNRRTPTAIDYAELGASVARHLRFSYLFLTRNGRIIVPWQASPSPEIEGIHAEEFERRYISSRPRTAVTPCTGSAQDGSLFEFEFVRCRDDESRPLFWSGYVWIDAGGSLPASMVFDALSRLQIGGERRYGFGRLRLRGVTELSAENANILGVHGECTGDGPTIDLQPGVPIPFHFEVNALPLAIAGAYELFLGRSWIEAAAISGPGRRLESIGLCWMPGSVIASVDRGRLFARIDHNGILRLPIAS